MKQTFLILLTMAGLATLTACAGSKAQPENKGTGPGGTAAVPSQIKDEQAGIYARLARLESDVAGVKGQISQLGPILEKMPALQEKLGELVTELQRIDARVAAAQAHVESFPPVVPVQTPQKAPPSKGLVTPILSGAPTPAAPTPVVKPIVPKVVPEKAVQKPVEAVVPAAKPPLEAKKVEGATLNTGAASVRQIRVGDYPDKTRVVLDVSRKVLFTTDLDNAEKILIIDLDAAEFLAPAGANFAKSPLVASYTTQMLAGGKSRVILQLREAVDLARVQTLPPNGDKGDRVVLDLVQEKP